MRSPAENDRFTTQNPNRRRCFLVTAFSRDGRLSRVAHWQRRKASLSKRRRRKQKQRRKLKHTKIPSRSRRPLILAFTGSHCFDQLLFFLLPTFERPNGWDPKKKRPVWHGAARRRRIPRLATALIIGESSRSNRLPAGLGVGFWARPKAKRCAAQK